jgi:hypothetical protein
MVSFGFPPTRQSRYLAREIFHLMQEYRTLNPDMRSCRLRYNRDVNLL